jgi:hypothetical protein
MGGKKQKSKIELIIDEKFREAVEACGSWCYSRGYAMHKLYNPETKKRTTIYLHRVVYELAHGTIPAGLHIDHIDGNKSNNLLSNLRLVTHQENHFNRTKAKGYYWFKRDKKWMAYIGLNGKNKHIGYYDTEQEAHQAYLNAKQEMHIIQDHKQNIAVAQ